MPFYNRETDVVLFPITDHPSKESLLPHMDSSYSIVYREDEMKLSPTWFLRTLSMEMWIFTIVAYFVVFFMFFLSLFLYRKYRKITDEQHSTLGEVFMYMWTFIASQGVETRWAKHAFWKIQVLNFSFLQIIVATGFSTFLVTLLSTKYFEMPFNELDDFTTIRSHNICVSLQTAAAKYFIATNNGTREPFGTWKGIVNEPICDPFLNTFFYLLRNVEQDICETKGKVAFVLADIDFQDKKFTCPIVKLSKLIPNIQRTVPVRSGYRYKEIFNRFIIRMMSSGIISRTQNKFKKFVDSSDVYQSMSTYSVETEGVMFMQVEYFVWFFVASVGLAFVVLLLEIIVNKLAKA